MYLCFDHANEFIEEKMEINTDSADENKELLKNAMMFGMGLEIRSNK